MAEPEPRQAQQSFWDGQAASYDLEPDHGLRDPHMRNTWRRLLESKLPPAPARIVDLGCGTGSLSVLLARSGHEVSGYDLSEPMLAVARDKASRVGVDIRFGVADASAPTIDEDCVDVLLVRHVLWALPDPAAALGRWCRLLGPTGRLILVEGWWHTGGGLRGTDVQRLVRQHRAEAELTELTDPDLWGGPISDERYLVLSRR
ncbi:MAG: class I SAM-dependent methyltransferase [Nocardioidaceae bacterium]